MRGSLLFSNPSWSGVGTVSNTVIRNVTALSVRLESSRCKAARF